MNRSRYYTKTTIIIKNIALDLEKLAGAKLKPYGLTFSQFKVIRVLTLEPPLTVRQVDLEECFCMTNPTVTSLLQNMEKNGWIERRENPADSRSKVLCMTEKAKKIADELESLGNQIDGEITSSLTKKEKAELNKLLLKILDIN